ncbi:MAG TPA: hypothetical protein VHV09_10010 [Trebonia sp.]|nr:hypothetical protein [Trebonia sp.]
MGWQEDYGAPHGYLEPDDAQPRRDRPWQPESHGPDAHWRGYGRADSAFWLQGQPQSSRDYRPPSGPQSQPGGNPPPPPGPVPRSLPSPRKGNGPDWQTDVAVLLIFVGLFCGAGAWWLHTARSDRAGASARPAAVALNQSARIRTSAGAAECAARKTSGDLYVRTAEPGRLARARETGGKWVWDNATGKCLSALAYTITTAGKASGECTTVGYVADNRGYDPHALPAAALPDRAGEAGSGC